MHSFRLVTHLPKKKKLKTQNKIRGVTTTTMMMMMTDESAVGQEVGMIPAAATDGTSTEHHEQPKKQIGGGDFVLHSTPKQRQRWGEQQVSPR